MQHRLSTSCQSSYFDAFFIVKSFIIKVCLISVLTHDIYKSFFCPAKLTSAWIGGTDILEEGKFLWEGSGKSVQVFGWDGGEPNNHAGKEHCNAFWGTRTKWHDANCGTKLQYICQMAGKY